MRVERLARPDAAAARALAPLATDAQEAVRAIVQDVRARGDAALDEYVARFDGVTSGAPLRVGDDELDAALEALSPDVRAGLETAIANVGEVARAQVGVGAEITLPEGHTVTVKELPVRRAAIYVPGGRAPYPSTVVMGVITAAAAAVEEVAVCAPGAHPVILAACRLCGADDVYRMGGAHAVAALAYGTERVARADVIAGPGNEYVQLAKLHVSREVGIDGFFGPSDVLVLAGPEAEPELVAADLRAQAEHGEGTIVACASPDAGLLDAVAALLEAASDTGAVAVLAAVEDADDALRFAEAFAPEHLELVGAEMEALLPLIRSAGCVFTGRAGATAFGDYVAGSNHSLPTGGSARFASALGPRVFRRRMSVVDIGAAAAALANAGAPIARAEGFEEHARSMELRENGPR